VGSIDDPERERYPAFNPERAMDVVVEQGDILFIPEFFWHEVHSLDSPSASLSIWWSESPLAEIEKRIQTITQFFELAQTAPSAWRQLIERLCQEQGAG
jgi:ribosomal protein L16 Arg81 hydroxylase